MDYSLRRRCRIRTNAIAQTVDHPALVTFDVNRPGRYGTQLIRSYRDRDVRELFEQGTRSPKWSLALQKVAVRKLQQLNAAAQLNDLRAPPGNRLEALRGDRTGLYSIRINSQFRI